MGYWEARELYGNEATSKATSKDSRNNGLHFHNPVWEAKTQRRALVPVAPTSPLCWCSSWPCTTAELSFEQLTQRGNSCLTERPHCWGSGSLFIVCLGWGFGFFGVLWHHHPKWLLTLRLNDFSRPALSFYNLILLWTVTRVCFVIVSPNVMLTHFVLCSFLSMPFTIHSSSWFFSSEFSVFSEYFSYGSI